MKKRVSKYVVPSKDNQFRPYLLRAAGLISIFVFLFGTIFASSLHRLILRTSDFIAAVLPGVLVDLANADRTAFALRHLSVNQTLEEAARMKAQDMAARGYFAHESPDGKTPWYWFSKAGYRFAYAGENLAVNFEDSSAVNTAWMNSPGHRANILNGSFTEIGIATARGMYNGRETTFVVQLFGTPSAVPTRVPTRTQAAAGPRLVPVAESSVLSASGEQVFLAVKDETASPAAAVSAGNMRHSSLAERFITSPTKLLAVVHVTLGLILMLLLSYVIFVKHDYRTRHIVYSIALIIVIIVAYSTFRYQVVSSVELFGNQSTSLLLSQ